MFSSKYDEAYRKARQNRVVSLACPDRIGGGDYQSKAPDGKPFVSGNWLARCASFVFQFLEKFCLTRKRRPAKPAENPGQAAPG